MWIDHNSDESMWGPSSLYELTLSMLGVCVCVQSNDTSYWANRLSIIITARRYALARSLLSPGVPPSVRHVSVLYPNG